MTNEERESTNRNLVGINNLQPPSSIQSNLDDFRKLNSIEDTSKNMTKVNYDYTLDELGRAIKKIEQNPHEYFSQVVSPFTEGRKEDYKVPVVGGVTKWLDIRRAAGEGHPLSEKDLVPDPDKVAIRSFIQQRYGEYLKSAGEANFKPTKEAIELRDTNKNFLAAISLMNDDSLKFLSKADRKLTPADKQAIFQEVVNSYNQRHELSDRLQRILNPNMSESPTTTSQPSTPTTTTSQTTTPTNTITSQPSTPTTTTSQPTVPSVSKSNILLGSEKPYEPPFKFIDMHPHGGNPIVEINGSRFVLGSWEHPLAKTLLASMLARETNESKGTLQNKLLEEAFRTQRENLKATLEQASKTVESYWNAYMKAQEGLRNSKDVSYKELIPPFLQYAEAKNKQAALLGQPTVFDIPPNSIYDIVGVATDPSGRVVYDPYTGAPLIKVKRKGDPKAPEQVWSFIKKS